MFPKYLGLFPLKLVSHVDENLCQINDTINDTLHFVHASI